MTTLVTNLPRPVGLRSEPADAALHPRQAQPAHDEAALGSPWRDVAALFVAYGLAALVSIVLSRHPGTIASIWFANAVAIAALAQRRRAHWPWLLAATAAANVLANTVGGASVAVALSFVPANLAEVMLGALLLCRQRLDSTALRSPGRMLWLLLLGGVLPQVAGASVGALTISWHGFAPFVGVWLPWFEGSVIGSVSVLPLALLCWTQGTTPFRAALRDPRVFVLAPLSVGVTLLVLAHVTLPFVHVALVLVVAAVMVDLAAVTLLTLLASLTIALSLALGVLVPPPTSAAWEQVFVYLAYAAALLPAQVLSAAMAEVRDGYSSLADRTAELQRANEGLEQFVRMASHDLREPLNTVTQFGDLLAQDEGPRLSDRGRLYLDLMIKGATRQRALLDDVLHFARLRRGETVPQQTVALDAVFDEARAGLAASVGRRDARVDVEPLPQVRGHPHLLSLLFQNLLSNALKFVPAGRAPHVRVTARVEGAVAWIVVTDNGIGLTGEEQSRLFQPFQRLHPQRDYEGTGLGLALAQQVARQHDGEIRVRSVPGVGSSFEVRLPLA